MRRIPAEILLKAQSKLDELANILAPCFVSLTPAERKMLVEIGADKLKFLEFSHEMAVENPDLFPAFMKADVFKENYFLTRELCILFNKINELRDSICDSKTVAGNLALETALTFYQTVKFAARRDIPGTRMIYDELKLFFPSRRQRRQKDS